MKWIKVSEGTPKESGTYHLRFGGDRLLYWNSEFNQWHTNQYSTGSTNVHPNSIWLDESTPSKGEGKEDEFYIWNGIDGELQEVDSIDDLKDYIKDYTDQEEGIHPDIESIFALKKVASIVCVPIEGKEDTFKVQIQHVRKGEPCSPLSAEEMKEQVRNLLDKKAKEQYNNSGSFSCTPFGLDGIPFVRRDAIVDFCFEVMTEYAASLLTKRDEEVRELKSKCEADHCSIDELLSEFNRRGVNTENWGGDDFAEAAIVSGVKNHIELRVELLLSERDKYKALAEAADSVITQNPFSWNPDMYPTLDYAYRKYNTLKQQ